MAKAKEKSAEKNQKKPDKGNEHAAGTGAKKRRDRPNMSRPCASRCFSFFRKWLGQQMTADELPLEALKELPKDSMHTRVAPKAQTVNNAVS